jgi:hypothetical protein
MWMMMIMMIIINDSITYAVWVLYMHLAYVLKLCSNATLSWVYESWDVMKEEDEERCFIKDYYFLLFSDLGLSFISFSWKHMPGFLSGLEPKFLLMISQWPHVLMPESIPRNFRSKCVWTLVFNNTIGDSCKFCVMECKVFLFNI